MGGDDRRLKTSQKNLFNLTLIMQSLKFQSILKYIVNPKDESNQISNSTKEVLKFAGLMKSYDDAIGDSVVLTAAAFQFLLWNRKVQIWYFIIQLLEYFWQVR